jgi:anti-anti-sigma factor
MPFSCQWDAPKRCQEFNWIFTVVQPSHNVQSVSSQAPQDIKRQVRGRPNSSQARQGVSVEVRSGNPHARWRHRSLLQGPLYLLRRSHRFLQTIAGLLPLANRVVVELSGLDAIDRAGLGELVVVHMWAKATGCSLKLAGANPRIQQLFALTNLLAVFDVHSTLDDALVSFQPRAAEAKIAVHAA